MSQRITHMLVLIDRKPAKGEAAFVQGMLGWLYASDGQPYSRLVDAETKMHVMIVGPQDFSEDYIAHMALVHFPAIWNRTPVLNEIKYQRFHGPEGNGTTIEQRTSVTSTEATDTTRLNSNKSWLKVLFSCWSRISIGKSNGNNCTCPLCGKSVTTSSIWTCATCGTKGCGSCIIASTNINLLTKCPKCGGSSFTGVRCRTCKKANIKVTQCMRCKYFFCDSHGKHSAGMFVCAECLAGAHHRFKGAVNR